MIPVLATFTMFAIIALTDLQIDRVFDAIAAAGRAFSEGVKALWIAFGPLLVSWVIWRQSQARKLAQSDKSEILGAGSEREARLSAQVTENTELTHAVKAVAVESVKKADKAYNEANNLNLKLESMGVQTKPVLGESAENPVHTVTP